MTYSYIYLDDFVDDIANQFAILCICAHAHFVCVLCQSVVIFEGLYEGLDGVCDFAKNGKFRGKGLLNKGVLELTFSDDKGKTFYNEGQERLAVKISK